MLGLWMVLAASPSLYVEVSPAEEPCRLGQRVPAALLRVAPDLEVALGAPRTDALALTLAVGPEGLVLNLRDPSGPGIQDRRLPNPPEACAATADGVALIVERHLRSLGILPPLPPPPGPGSAASATIAVARPSGPTSGAPLLLLLSAEAQLQAPAATGARAGVGADLRLGWGRLSAGLGLSFFVPGEAEVRRKDRPLGTYRVQALLLRGTLGVCLPLAGALCLSGLGGVERVAGSAAGRLPTQKSASELRAVLGLEARYDWIFVGPLGLSAQVSALYRPAPASFTVVGADQDYEDPGFTLMVGLGACLQIL